LSDKVIEAARPKTRVIQAGALQFKMQAGEEKFAKIDTYPSLGWYGENETIDSDDLGLSALDFRAQKIAVIVPISLELLEDGNGVDRVVSEALSSSLAQALDRIAFYGVGGDRPLGLLNTDIGSTTVSSAPAVTELMNHVINAEFQLLDENLIAEEISMLYNSSFGKSMALMTDAADHYLGTGNAPLPYVQMQKFMSNQLEDVSDVSPVVFGRFSDLFIGVKQAARIEMSKFAGTAFEKNQALIRITWRGDILPVVPAHFHILQCAV
jgi:HK97 family phage major capsid protein